MTRPWICSAIFALSLSTPGLTRAAAPLTRPIQVVALLKKASAQDLAAAVDRVKEACRGSMRRALRDYPPLFAEVRHRTRQGSVPSRRVALDTFRCFSPAKQRALLAPLFGDGPPRLVAYALEVAARTEDPALVGPMLEALAGSKTDCMKAKLDPEAVDVCVWLTYAPGACLSGAGRSTRAAAAKAAVAMFESPHPKVREVAVETVASARLEAYAADVARLIEREKAGEFAQANDATLLARFEKRRRSLMAGDE